MKYDVNVLSLPCQNNAQTRLTVLKDMALDFQLYSICCLLPPLRLLGLEDTHRRYVGPIPYMIFGMPMGSLIHHQEKIDGLWDKDFLRKDLDPSHANARKER